MVSTIASAVSGFAASAERLNSSAQKIANANNTLNHRDSSVKEAYAARRGDQLLQTENVGKTDALQVNSPADTAHSSDQDGIVHYSQDDLGEQLVNAQLSVYTAQANLSAIKVQDRLANSIIDIVS